MSDFGANIFDDEPRPARARPDAATRTDRNRDRDQPQPERGASQPPPAPRPPAAAPPRPHPEQRDRRDRQRPHHAPKQRREAAPPARSPQPVEPRHARPATPGAGVALLIDLDALEAEARAAHGELARNRLERHLARDREVLRAVAVAGQRRTPPGGFELQLGGNAAADGIRLAATAIDLLAVAGRLVLAPATPELRQLAMALRAAGHSVELAGLDSGGDADVRQLGRECLFVP